MSEIRNSPEGEEKYGPNGPLSDAPRPDGDFGVPDVHYQASPQWADRQRAKSEDKNWEEQKADQRAENELMLLRNYGQVVLWSTRALVFFFVVAAGVWTWHYLTPSSWGWLHGDDRLNKLQSILFSGGIGATVSTTIFSQVKRFGNSE